MDEWTEEAPTEPGMYWFYGDYCVGSMGQDYFDDFEPDNRMELVEVFEISNGMMADTRGKFMSLKKFDKNKRKEGHVGKWMPAILPNPPQFN